MGRLRANYDRGLGYKMELIKLSISKEDYKKCKNDLSALTAWVADHSLDIINQGYGIYDYYPMILDGEPIVGLIVGYVPKDDYYCREDRYKVVDNVYSAKDKD